MNMFGSKSGQKNCKNFFIFLQIWHSKNHKKYFFKKIWQTEEKSSIKFLHFLVCYVCFRNCRNIRTIVKKQWYCSLDFFLKSWKNMIRKNQNSNHNFDLFSIFNLDIWFQKKKEETILKSKSLTNTTLISRNFQRNFKIADLDHLKSNQLIQSNSSLWPIISLEDQSNIRNRNFHNFRIRFNTSHHP